VVTGLPEIGTILGFAAVSFALVVAPGPNLIYILTRSVSQGRRAGLVSAAGVETGTLVHVLAATLGVSTLIAASPVAFTVLKFAGAAYLIFLGVRALFRPAALGLAEDVPAVPLSRVYRDGVLVNVLNPKVGLFFVAFLPQFVTPHAEPDTTRAQMLVLGVVFFVLALMLDIAYSFAGDLVRGLLRRRPGYLRRHHYLVAAVYLGLGAFAVVSGVG
jgi:threonine/homoserine/homoserine lactone efflux protein